MSPFDISSTVRLASGYEMPRLGLGVYQTPSSSCESLVRHAIAVGYRHIDSATVYRNEQPCSQAISTSPIAPRSAIFFTTKLPPRTRGYHATKTAIDKVLAQNPGLGGYIDLYLIHAPFGGRDARIGSWKAMAEACEEGKVRSLGVSNYSIGHLDELWEWIGGGEKRGCLSVGQWEVTPWCARREWREWCRRRGVVVQAYSPLVRGTRFGEPVLKALADKYRKTPAQILVRWSLQNDLVPLPKSARSERISENANVFDFQMAGEDVAWLETDEYTPCTWDPTKEPL